MCLVSVRAGRTAGWAWLSASLIGLCTTLHQWQMYRSHHINIYFVFSLRWFASSLAPLTKRFHHYFVAIFAFKFFLDITFSVKGFIVQTCNKWPRLSAPFSFAFSIFYTFIAWERALIIIAWARVSFRRRKVWGLEKRSARGLALTFSARLPINLYPTRL